MLKAILYMLLFASGITLTFCGPLIGAITCLEAYLLNPYVIAKDAPLQRYQFYAALAFMLSIVLYHAKPLPAKGRESWIIKALFAYVAIALLTSFWPAADFAWTFEHAFDFSKTIVIAAMLICVIRRERDMRIVLLACMLGAMHAAFMHTFGVDLQWVSERYADEIGVLPDFQGAVMVFFLPFFMIFAMYGKGWERLMAWVGFPLVLNSIIETYQRSYFVALVAQMVLLLLFLPRRVALRLVPVIAVGLILFVTVLTPENYWEWMGTLLNPTEDGSANSRVILYQSSWEMLKDHPFGVGYRNYLFVSQKYLPAVMLDEEGGRAAHSTICTIACETGVPGLLAWSLAVIIALWCLRGLRRNLRHATTLTSTQVCALAAELGLYGWLAGGLFHSDHEMDPAYWFLCLTVCLVRLQAGSTREDADEEAYVEADTDQPLEPELVEV